MDTTKKGKSFNEWITGNQPVLVDFYATWCGPCKAMQPVLEEVAQKLNGMVKILKVDVDKNPSAASNFQVRGVPTLILFQNNKTLWRQSGVVPSNKLVQIIKEHTLISSP